MIYRIRVPQTNTIYSRLPLNNSGGDHQMVFRNKYNDISRLLFSANIDDDDLNYDEDAVFEPLENDPYIQYSDFLGCNLVLYTSHADLYTGKTFQIHLHNLQEQWDAGFNMNSIKPNAQLQGSSWTNRMDEIGWKDTYDNEIGGGSFYQGDYVPYYLNYRTIYNPIRIPISFAQACKGVVGGYNPLNCNGYLLKFEDQEDETGQINIYSSKTNSPLFPVYQFFTDIDWYWQEQTIDEGNNDDDYKVPPGGFPNVGGIGVTTTKQNNVIENIQNFTIQIKDFQNQYRINQIIKFDLQFFPKKYSKDWTSSYWTQTDKNYYVPQGFYATYAIYDTTQIRRIPIIQHSYYTKLSYDGVSNYFDLIMDQFVMNRRYTIELNINNRIYDVGEFRIA